MAGSESSETNRRESLEDKLAALDGKYRMLETVLFNQDAQIDRLITETKELDHENEALREEVKFLHKQADEALEKCGVLERALNALHQETRSGAPKIKPPRPESFRGSRDAKEVENFIFDMEQYFRVLQIEEPMKVDAAVMYLADDAKLWWRNRYADIIAGRCRIETWAEFKRELEYQFYPQNTEFSARMRLDGLTHKNSIRDYVNEYQSCMLEIKNMSEEDRMFNFVKGLKEWAKREVWRSKPQTLQDAVTAAMRQMDYPGTERVSSQKRASSPKSRPTSPATSPRSAEGGSRVSSGNYRRNGGGNSQRMGSSSPRRTETGAGSSASNRTQNAQPCILCRGPHRWYECSHKNELHKIQQKLSAMEATVGPPEASESEEEAELGASPRRVSSIRLMYAMGKQAPVKRRPSTKPMFVEIEVNGQKARALLDTGASHNFATEKEAKRLGLKISPCAGKLKTVNSKAKPIVGEARGASTKIGEWEGQIDFTVVDMDDFDLVLGLEFLLATKTTLMPHLGSALIEANPSCLVRTIDSGVVGRKEAPSTLSFMRLVCEKEEKRGDYKPPPKKKQHQQHAKRARGRSNGTSGDKVVTKPPVDSFKVGSILCFPVCFKVGSISCFPV